MHSYEIKIILEIILFLNHDINYAIAENPEQI